MAQHFIGVVSLNRAKYQISGPLWWCVASGQWTVGLLKGRQPAMSLIAGFGHLHLIKAPKSKYTNSKLRNDTVGKS